MAQETKWKTFYKFDLAGINIINTGEKQKPRDTLGMIQMKIIKKYTMSFQPKNEKLILRFCGQLYIKAGSKKVETNCQNVTNRI